MGVVRKKTDPIEAAVASIRRAIARLNETRDKPSLAQA